MIFSPISISCPFPSLQPKEKLDLLIKNDPSLARKKLVNESLLIDRIALTLLGTFCAYNLLTYTDVYASAILLTGSALSLPSLLLGTSSYFLYQGLSSILFTKEMSSVFQNFFLGGAEIATALSILYFYDIKPIGLLEPELQKSANLYALEKEKAIKIAL